MMNLVKLQEQLKDFSQQQLSKEMQMPSGNVPQFLVLSEMQRRKRMESQAATDQAQQNQTTVAEDVVAAAGVPQQGLAGMAQAMAPQTDMSQNTGQAPVQQMYGGGVIKAQSGAFMRDDTVLSGRQGMLEAGLPLRNDPAIRALANRSNMSIDDYIASMDPRALEANVARVRKGSQPQTALDVFDPALPVLSQVGEDELRMTEDQLGTALEEAALFGEGANPSFDYDTEMADRFGIGLTDQQDPANDITGIGNSIAAVSPLVSDALDAPRPAGLVEQGDPDRILDLYDGMGGARGVLDPVDRGSTMDRARLALSESTPDNFFPALSERDALMAPILARLPTDSPDMDSPDMDGAPGFRPESGPDRLTPSPSMAGAPGFRPEDSPYSLLEQFPSPPSDDSESALGNFLSNAYEDVKNTAAVLSPFATEEDRMRAAGNLGAMDTGDLLTVPEGGIEELMPPTPVKNTATNPDGSPKTTDAPGGAKSGGSSLGGSGKAVMSDLEKSLEQDKWLSLAKFGLALMSSREPTLGGAIGEAGIAAIGDFQAAKKNYEDTRLARETLAARRAGSSGKKGLTPSNLISLRGDLAKELSDISFAASSGTATAALLERAQELESQITRIDSTLGLNLGSVSSDAGAYNLSSTQPKT